MKMIAILSIWSSVDSYINHFGNRESLGDSIYVLLQFIIISGTSATIDIYAAALSGFVVTELISK